MIYLLLLLLVFLCIGAFLLFDKNILSPSVIACGVFIISTVVAAANSRIWGFSMAPVTVLVIVTALMAFCTGEYVAHKLYVRRELKKPSPPFTLPTEPIRMPWQIMLILCSVIAMLLAYFYHATIIFIANATDYNGTGNVLGYIYTANLTAAKAGIRARNLLANQGMQFAKSTAYIFGFCFLYNTIFFGKMKRNIFFLLPTILYIPFAVLSGGRTDFIKLFTLWLFIGSFFYLQKNQWKTKASLKIIAVFFCCAIAFIAVFLATGILRGWSSKKPDLLRYTGIYIGGSIQALDAYLLNPTHNGTYFGEHTLLGIYSGLRTIGFNFPPFYPPLDSIPGGVTNIFTALRRYIEDFHYAGMYGAVLFIGMFYSLFFLLIKRKQNVFLVIYASIFYAIAEFAIEERFFLTIISIGTASNIFYLTLLYYLIVDKCIPKILIKEIYR